MVRVFGFILILGLLAGRLFFTAHPAEATSCYFHSESVGYVCDANPEPPIFVTPQPVAGSFLNYTTYARVNSHADVYPEPGAPTPLYNKGKVYFFATIANIVDVNGVRWYQIAPGQWVEEDSIQLTQASAFQGVELRDQPPRPFGWILQEVRPSSRPGGDPNLDLPRMERYDFFQVYDAAEADDGWIWYNVGYDAWIRQTYVSLIDPKPRPEGVGANEFWVEVDLYEQNFAAYEGDRMVYAGLVSSGLNRWPTYEGFFQVWDRFLRTKMSGSEGQPDYYYIQEVPHVMYFDRLNGIALHGAFWHDRFGYKQSHGCVNMPPKDAEWVYHWSARAPNDLWVWVHTSDPNHYFDKYKSSWQLSNLNH